MVIAVIFLRDTNVLDTSLFNNVYASIANSQRSNNRTTENSCENDENFKQSPARLEIPFICRDRARFLFYLSTGLTPHGQLPPLSPLIISKTNG